MVLFGKTKAASEYVKFANMFVLLQAFLRQNIMIDSGSVMYDQWIVVQWQELIFFSKSSRLVLRITQPLIHRIIEASVIGGKMTMA
jgi:hypothetical protein